jgi:predicted HNH restriction endonuclease
MPKLHIVQGGIENGDKKWIEQAARNGWSSRTWIAPRKATSGDLVVVYVAGYRFFATARVKSPPKRRQDWFRRYGAPLESIKLIKPAISLATIQQQIPELTWAKYPRSITTPAQEVADRVRKLINERRKTGISGFDEKALAAANIDELRAIAMLGARSSIAQKERRIAYRVRSRAIHLYVLCRSAGRCEGCNSAAPFLKADGTSYLEPHHITRLADDGPDHPAKVIALCPNCHRRAHHACDAKQFNLSLKTKLAKLEKRK